MRSPRIEFLQLVMSLVLAASVMMVADAAKSSPHPARTPARQPPRESREDLERRVERLEQLYELKEPAMPDAAAPATRPPMP